MSTDKSIQDKPWPTENKPAYFTDIANPLCDAIRFAYDMTRKNEEKDIPWDGLDIGKRDKVACLSPAEHLSANILAYEEEDQDRDALQVIVGLAVRLGIEQGRRCAYEDAKPRRLIIKTLATMVLEEEKNGRNSS